VKEVKNNPSNQTQNTNAEENKNKGRYSMPAHH
jgi:hypothetical protein